MDALGANSDEISGSSEVRWLAQTREFAALEIAPISDETNQHMRDAFTLAREAERSQFPWLLPEIPIDADMPYRFEETGIGVYNTRWGGDQGLLLSALPQEVVQGDLTQRETYEGRPIEYWPDSRARQWSSTA